MKKILYSIIVALILSVILALFVPFWLFRGDARWTYQNDAARVDVSFKGHLKNGHVSAAGTDLEVRQPTWLSNESYQGVVVDIPVSYRNKTCQIKLTPKADEWGGDAALVMELKGSNFQHGGKRRPAWVCFQNITLNGHPVATERVVWHNEPFVLRYPLPSSPEITLAFDVRKPLAASDISFVNPLVVFSAFFLLILFFSPLKKVACRVLTFINRKDIVKALKDGYLHIDPVYRRSFWIIFGVICFAFGFHTICFMWGNHDWFLLDSKQRWFSLVWAGRYMIYAVKIPLSNGIYLPLIYDLIIFITLAFNAVLLCRYWCLEKRVIYYVLCGLVLTAQPFTLSMMYFVHMTPEVFIGVTCALAALLLSEKLHRPGISLIGKIVYSLFAIVLVNFALAMYPVLINTIAVAFAGRLLVQSFDWDGSMQRLKLWLKPVVTSTINIILGIALYKWMVSHVFPMAQHAYNTDTLPLEQIPKRLGILFKQCFHQLYEYEYPFISQWILWVFLGFTLVLVLYICSTGKLRQRVVRLFLLFGALFATQTAMIIAKVYLVGGRVELFGLVFFEVLVMVLIITRIRQIYNLWVIAGACIIFSSIINDLDCLRVWKLGFDAEKMLWNRVLARLEIRKDFRLGRKYDIIEIGDHSSISLRRRYYTGVNKGFRDGAQYILNNSYDDNYRIFIPYEVYYPVQFLSGRKYPFAMRKKPEYVAALKRLYQAGVLQKAEAWPKPNGLIVWKDTILFVTDGKELEMYKKQFERELGKK